MARRSTTHLLTIAWNRFSRAASWLANSRHMLCSPHSLKLVTVLAAPALIPLALLWSWCLQHWVMPRSLEQNPTLVFCAQGKQGHVLWQPGCLTILCWVGHYSSVCEQSHAASREHPLCWLILRDIGAGCWRGLCWFNWENQLCSCRPSPPLPPILELKLSKPRIDIWIASWPEEISQVQPFCRFSSCGLALLRQV